MDTAVCGQNTIIKSQHRNAHSFAKYAYRTKFKQIKLRNLKINLGARL